MIDKATYYLIEHTQDFQWKVALTLTTMPTTDWRWLGRTFAQQLNLNPDIVNNYSEFNNNHSRFYVIDEWTYDHEYKPKINQQKAVITNDLSN